MRNSTTILALALVSVCNLEAAPASNAQVFEASQAKGGQLMQTDKGKPAVFFPTAAPAGDKIVWTPDAPLPPGLWQVDVEFHHTGNPTSFNEMLVFEGAGGANLGKLDFYYSWIQKGTSTKSYGFHNSVPMQSLALLKSAQRNQDTVAVTSIRITPGNASALERQQFVFSVPVNGPSVSLPQPLPPGLYVAKTDKPVALDWALPDGRRFATPAAAETRVFLDQAAQPSVTSGGPIQEILLNHYPISAGPDMSSAGTEPLLTVFDPAKIESRTLKLIGYHGTELPKPDLLPGGKSVAVVTSWDDGPEQDAILTDLLVKYGFKGTLVMNRGSKILGRLRELEAKGMEIGAHSWSHPAFYLSSPKRCLDEAVEMRRFLEKEFGHPVISFAYPYNYQPAYDADGDYVLRAVREAGYLSARATSSGDNHIEAIPDPLQMRPNFHFNAGAVRVKAKFEELLKTPGSILYIWGHSYELTPAGIKTLEEGLAAVASRPEAWYATLGQLMVWKYMREHLQIEPAAPGADGQSLTLKMPWIHPFWRQVPLSLAELAEKSGYPEVATVPWLPIGESMSFLMVNGLGKGRPNRCIALIYACDISSWIFTQSIPILGLQGTGGEWGQKGVDIRAAWRRPGNYYSACENRKKSAPNALITMMVDPCGGHFTCSDPMIDYMASYIDRVAKARLSDDGSAALKPVDVNQGFLAHLPIYDIGDQPIESARGATDTGRPWFFDRADAEKAQAIARTNWGAATQFPLVQAGEGCTVTPWGWNSVTTVALKTSGDFSFRPFLFDATPAGFLNAGQPLAKTAKLPQVEWVGGPIAPLGNNRFCVELDRNYKNGKVQVTSSLGVVAEGTADIRKSLQPLVINFSYNTEGTPQTISFKEIGDIKAGTDAVMLDAKASSGLPVKFFVESGPAIINGNRLILTQIPPNTKFPLAVTVAAWQWGTCTAPLYQMAITYQTFNMIK